MSDSKRDTVPRITVVVKNGLVERLEMNDTGYDSVDLNVVDLDMKDRSIFVDCTTYRFNDEDYLQRFESYQKLNKSILEIAKHP